MTGTNLAPSVTADTFIGDLTATAIVNSGTLTERASIVAAAGTTQGGATLIGSTMHVLVTVTASSEGVRLPAATTGRMINVFVPGSVGVKVYPFLNGKIDSASTNAALALAAGKGSIFIAKNTTQWHVCIKGS